MNNLKTIITTILLIFFPILSYCQYPAIIDDKDGFTNLRKEPDKNGEVIYKIKEYEIFFVNGLENDSTVWEEVQVPLNKFTITEEKSCTSVSTLKGYIHKSRLKYLHELENYNGDDFSFKYIIADFNQDKHIISRDADKFVEKIDGRFAFGIDGYLPHKEVIDLEIIINENKIFTHRALYEDLFECRNKFDTYKVNNTFIVDHFNSDGAGAYSITWVINKEGIQQRIIFNCF